MEIQMNAPLSVSEANELQRCELVIKQGLETFIEVGQALLIIRDKRLYRLESETFEDYCRGKWGMARQNANRLIAASEVISNLEPVGSITPQSERQARPLASLPPEQQRQAWQEVVQQSQQLNEPITAQKVQAVAQTFKQAKQEYREVKEAERAVQIEKKTEGITIPIDQLERIAILENGGTVVLNMNRDLHLLRFATERSLYVRCDRFSEWGNPFIMGPDGDREEVCNNFEQYYMPFKRGLLSKISSLKGKALGCHCYPERCHCETLKTLADEA